MTDDIVERLARIRIVPVVVIDDASQTADLAAALVAGGIPCAEITLRTEAGRAAVAAAAAVPGFTAGAGTVLSLDDVDASADAGAQFIVSPGLDEDIVDRARQRGITVIPGIATATELQRAHRAGLGAVKFFPADRLGGLGTINSLSGPFPSMRFMPSGGVSQDNVTDYLAHPAVFAVGGSWMVPRATLQAGDFARVQELAAQAMALVGG
jgi:2-dehydro-3-deoxyphosphogluconate aldolase/(4S)-4-hydroxy-2-oxoglutarate aldolase